MSARHADDPASISATCFLSQYMRTSRQADYVLLQLVSTTHHASSTCQNQLKSSQPPPASDYVHGGREGTDAGSALQATTGGRAEHGGVWLGRKAGSCCGCVSVEMDMLVIITTVIGEVGNKGWSPPANHFQAS